MVRYSVPIKIIGRVQHITHTIIGRRVHTGRWVSISTVISILPVRYPVAVVIITRVQPKVVLCGIQDTIVIVIKVQPVWDTIVITVQTSNRNGHCRCHTNRGITAIITTYRIVKGHFPIFRCIRGIGHLACKGVEDHHAHRLHQACCRYKRCDRKGRCPYHICIIVR